MTLEQRIERLEHLVEQQQKVFIGMVSGQVVVMSTVLLFLKERLRAPIADLVIEMQHRRDQIQLNRGLAMEKELIHHAFNDLLRIIESDLRLRPSDDELGAALPLTRGPVH